LAKAFAHHLQTPPASDTLLKYAQHAGLSDAFIAVMERVLSALTIGMTNHDCEDLIAHFLDMIGDPLLVQANPGLLTITSPEMRARFFLNALPVLFGDVLFQSRWVRMLCARIEGSVGSMGHIKAMHISSYQPLICPAVPCSRAVIVFEDSLPGQRSAQHDYEEMLSIRDALLDPMKHTEVDCPKLQLARILFREPPEGNSLASTIQAPLGLECGPCAVAKLVWTTLNPGRTLTDITRFSEEKIARRAILALLIRFPTQVTTSVIDSESKTEYSPLVRNAESEGSVSEGDYASDDSSGVTAKTRVLVDLSTPPPTPSKAVTCVAVDLSTPHPAPSKALTCVAVDLSTPHPAVAPITNIVAHTTTLAPTITVSREVRQLELTTSFDVFAGSRLATLEGVCPPCWGTALAVATHVTREKASHLVITQNHRSSKESARGWLEQRTAKGHKVRTFVTTEWSFQLPSLRGKMVEGKPNKWQLSDEQKPIPASLVAALLELRGALGIVSKKSVLLPAKSTLTPLHPNKRKATADTTLTTTHTKRMATTNATDDELHQDAERALSSAAAVAAVKASATPPHKRGSGPDFKVGHEQKKKSRVEDEATSSEDESTEVEDPQASMRKDIVQLKRTLKLEQQRFARETKKLLSDHAIALKIQLQEQAARLKQHQLDHTSAIRQVNQDHAIALRAQTQLWKTKSAEAEQKATVAEQKATAAELKAAAAEQSAVVAGRRDAVEANAAVAQAKAEGALLDQALAEARQQQKGMWDMMLHVLPILARAPAPAPVAVAAPAPVAVATAVAATAHTELDNLERCANILKNFRGPG
jgi:hypothetical protein